MKFILLVVSFCIFLSAKDTVRFSTTNIVKDFKNKLIWVDDKTTVTIKQSHKEAEPYCENLVHAGLRNWRLPDIKELQTIVDKKNDITYIIKEFKYALPDQYWAIKAHARTFWFYADYMHFISGTPYYDNRNKKIYVRCVSSMK